MYHIYIYIYTVIAFAVSVFQITAPKSVRQGGTGLIGINLVNDITAMTMRSKGRLLCSRPFLGKVRPVDPVNFDPKYRQWQSARTGLGTYS